MKILIYGSGGIGSYLGAYLLKNGHDVTFLAREKRFEFLKEKGLIIKSSIESFNLKEIVVQNQIKKIDSFDFIIICVKLYDFDYVSGTALLSIIGDSDLSTLDDFYTTGVPIRIAFIPSDLIAQFDETPSMSELMTTLEIGENDVLLRE